MGNDSEFLYICSFENRCKGLSQFIIHRQADSFSLIVFGWYNAQATFQLPAASLSGEKPLHVEMDELYTCIGKKKRS
jgi:hypothetical protein